MSVNRSNLDGSQPRLPALLFYFSKADPCPRFTSMMRCCWFPVMMDLFVGATCQTGSVSLKKTIQTTNQKVWDSQKRSLQLAISTQPKKWWSRNRDIKFGRFQLAGILLPKVLSQFETHSFQTGSQLRNIVSCWQCRQEWISKPFPQNTTSVLALFILIYDEFARKLVSKATKQSTDTQREIFVQNGIRKILLNTFLTKY